uniref:Uncharacterized protein n=1 Tax=viral metagenome TaxID=1070528 RepID=A0A6M3ISY3_9ZZZZ
MIFTIMYIVIFILYIILFIIKDPINNYEFIDWSLELYRFALLFGFVIVLKRMRK